MDIELKIPNINATASQKEHEKVTQLSGGQLLQFQGKVKINVDLNPYLNALKGRGSEPVLLQSLPRDKAVNIISMLSDRTGDRDNINNEIVQILNEEGYSHPAIELAMGDRMPSNGARV